MKALQVELPDSVAEELDAMVRAGWFESEREAVRLAIMEFLRHRRLELIEQFQRDGIAWALSQKTTRS